MAKTKRKPDGRSSRAPPKGIVEKPIRFLTTPLSPIHDVIGDQMLTLPDLGHSSQIQAATSDTLGNGDSSDQVRAEFQIISEDRKGDPQTNHEEDYESICKSSDLTPLEGASNRQVNTTPDEQNVLGRSTPQEDKAELMK